MSTVEGTPVEFRSGDGRCAARALAPTASTPRTCVVMANGFSLTVRDGLDTYARAFAAAGAGVLAFDYRHFGESPGEPRQHLRIGRQREDWRSAVSYVRKSHDRVVLWGFSLGGGLALDHATAPRGADAVIAVNPLADGMQRARSTSPVLLARLLPFVLRDLAGRPTTVPVTGPPGARAAMSRPGEAEGFASAVGADSQWRNEVSAGALVQTPWVRPLRRARRLSCPVWICLSGRDVSVSQRAIELVARRAPLAELHRYPGGHFDPLTPDAAPAMALDQVDFMRKHGLLTG